MGSPATISFARGAPSLDIVASAELSECAKRALANDPAGAFMYGRATGYEPLRQWIAEKHGVGTEQVLLTNGSMQADAFLFDLLIEASDGVIVEAPTYDRTLLSLQQRDADIAAIPVQSDGIDVGAVETMLDGGFTPKLAHVIPTFQNPSGRTLSLEKRRHLLELASSYDFLVFEDDPYYEIRFEGEPVERMLSIDGGEQVVHASSFSKTICPGVRVGYLLGPAKLIARLAQHATETYISPSMVSQAIVYEFCASGAIDRSIETVREALRQRRDALVEALQAELPRAKFQLPEGGYFLWAELPEEVEVSKLAVEAEDEGVSFVKGTDFLIEGGQNCLRLAYAPVTAEEAVEGVKRLARALERC